MKRAIFAGMLFFWLWFGFNIEQHWSIHAQALEPRITAFSTPAESVTRQALDARNARVLVAWATEDRPFIANLVFEQVLPDGDVINVELPRANPWVNSAGDGIAAPILPPNSSETAITLQVRLINLLSGTEYDRRTLKLPIVDGDSASGSTEKPALVHFGAALPEPISSAALHAGTLRIPVSWQAVNRPVTATLVFEQRKHDGTWVNVELPRDTPWVNSADSGMVAPVVPGEKPDDLLLRVRLVDLLLGRVYDQRELVLHLDTRIAADPVITLFSASYTSVDLGDLQAKTARIPVLWSVANRPPGTNLVFEQHLGDGVLRNVELPRDVPWVSSAGSGVVAPIEPGETMGHVELHLRLIRDNTGETLVEETVLLDIDGREDNGNAEATPEVTTEPEPEATPEVTTEPEPEATAEPDTMGQE